MNTTPNQNGNKAPQALETTITYLEMTAPTHHPAQLPMNINAALLTTHEIPLHFYRYLYFQVGIHWNWESRLRLNEDALAKQIHDENVAINVLYIDGAPAGFFETLRKDAKTTDLSYFGMMPHAFGRGLGRWFLSSAIEACWSGEPERVTVNTCTLDHPAALSLYQKMGFTPYKQEQDKIIPISANEIANIALNNGFISS